MTTASAALRATGLVSVLLLCAHCGSDAGTSTVDDAASNPGGNDGLSPGDGGGAVDLAMAGALPVCMPPIALAAPGATHTTIGSGDPSGCTEKALQEAVAKGGFIDFNCGAAPVTIALGGTLELPTDRDTVIDGNHRVTLDGGGKTRLLRFDHPDYRKNGFGVTLQRLTLRGGRAEGSMMYPAHPAPCSSGYYDGAGGALYIRDGVLHVLDCTFSDNHAAPLGPDVGGGAIYLAGVKEAIVTGTTFTGNSGSNGGAIGVLNSELDVYNSRFEGNSAEGFGANSDDANKCTFVDPVTRQHQVGSGGNGGAIAIDGGSDLTHTFCGVTFRGNQGGKGALGGAIFRTPDLSRQKTVIDRCHFDRNTGDSAAAGYFHNSTLVITASTFTGNVGQGIGALQADGTTFDFTNVTFVDNHSAAGVGATLALFGGDGKLVNCTFARNVCDAPNMFAAAIFGGPKLTITNCLFQGCTGRNPSEPMQCKTDPASSGGGNLQWPTMKLAGGADQPCVAGIQFADAAVGSVSDHGGPVPTALVAKGSPALGAGTNCPAADARGRSRPATGCTAGAAEGTE